MRINLIAAVDNNGLIGIQGKLPWNVSDDLKRFKRITKGHPVIMGRVTWESLPVKPLPNRCNLVLSSDLKYMNATEHGGIDCIDLDDALDCIGLDYDECFIIGGQRLFEEGIKKADKIYLTRIDTEIEPDETARYFPMKYLVENFKIVENEFVGNCQFMVWEKV